MKNHREKIISSSLDEGDILASSFKFFKTINKETCYNKRGVVKYITDTKVKDMKACIGSCEKNY